MDELSSAEGLSASNGQDPATAARVPAETLTVLTTMSSVSDSVAWFNSYAAARQFGACREATAGTRTRSVGQLSEVVILCVDEIAWHGPLSQVSSQVLDHRRRTTKKHVHIHNRAMDRAND